MTDVEYPQELQGFLSRMETVRNFGEGWDEGTAGPVSEESLQAALRLVLHAHEDGIATPGLFPMEFSGAQSGVTIEWSSPYYVVSVEVRPDGKRFDLFDLNVESKDVTTQLDNADETLAKTFISAALSEI